MTPHANSEQLERREKHGGKEGKVRKEPRQQRSNEKDREHFSWPIRGGSSTLGFSRSRLSDREECRRAEDQEGVGKGKRKSKGKNESKSARLDALGK